MIRKLLGRAKLVPHKYPILVTVIFVLLVCFGISGTSAGMYHVHLYGDSAQDDSLLYGKPSPIRSDEWVNWTVLTASQPENNFQKFNPNLSTGQNLALQPEVPIWDWSTLFRPHNWGFFLLPFENGFAFRWWFLFAVLLISSYFYALRHLKRSTLAILFSVIVALTPFLLWWYQTASIGVIAYGFIFMILFENLIKKGSFVRIKNKSVQLLAQSGILASLMMAFGLLFYPPFQIPIAIVLFFYCIGLALSAILSNRIPVKQLLVRTAPIIIGALLAIELGVIFVQQNSDVISALSNSVYPGSRVIESGGLQFYHLFNGHLQALLQSNLRSASYFTNQSEASNFLLIAPFLILPSIVLLIVHFRKTHHIDWLLAATNACIVFILIRLLTPFGQPLYELFLLDKVPPQRLLIGLGFAGFIQLVLLIKLYTAVGTLSSKTSRIFMGLSLVLSGSIIIYYTNFSIHHFPDFLTPSWIAVPLVIGILAVLASLLYNKPALALGILALFAVGSTFRITPLYTGIGELRNGALARAMDDVSDKKITWATVDFSTFEGLGSVVGDKTVTGVNTYPDIMFWEHAVGNQFEQIYNRQAHVILGSDKKQEEPIRLALNSTYVIRADCTVYKKLSVDYVLAPGTLNDDCLKLVKTVTYPNVIFHIYHYDNN